MKWTRAIAVSLALISAPLAWADMNPVPPPPGVLPSEPSAMAGLSRKHDAILRRADRSCAHQYGFYGGAQYRACVVGSVENAILLSQDPQLQAYHRSLPFPARYRLRG